VPSEVAESRATSVALPVLTALHVDSMRCCFQMPHDSGEKSEEALHGGPAIDVGLRLPPEHANTTNEKQIKAG
tara:strand:- start:22891 stop:23109 length:219 start_codon:yes stop_codon:yes gene_type:complete